MTPSLHNAHAASFRLDAMIAEIRNGSLGFDLRRIARESMEAKR